MIYPVAVIVIAALVVGAILWKVIPTFASCSPASAPAAAPDPRRHRRQQRHRRLRVDPDHRARRLGYA